MVLKHIFILCILLSSFVYAEDGEPTFDLIWTDFFPACGAESGRVDYVRCGCEFLIPNFHIGMIGNMISNSVISFLLVKDLMSLLTDLVTNPVGTTLDFAGSIFWGVVHVFAPDFRDPDWHETQGVTGTFSTILNGVLKWMFGVVTPVLAIILILSFEFIKTYLLLTIPFMLWVHVGMEINLISNAPQWGIKIAILTVVVLFLGTIWLLGSDMGLYRPLVVW